MAAIAFTPDVVSLMTSGSADKPSKLQQIFVLAGGHILGDKHLALSYEQQRAVKHITDCRTIGNGFNLEVCDTCGRGRLHYNSCSDRNCPRCQGLKKEIWVDLRSSEVLDCAYYHAVFTCPHELNPLFLNNKKLLYSMFHKCVG